MKKYTAFLSLAVLLLLQSTGFAQTERIEEVDQKDEEITIPYEKYKLDNGLTLIIHEDHSDPLVHVDVTYHVGSAREELKKSGFAHFFEHMMFQGSENVADEEHFKIITDAGGTLNGTTNRDRTNYFETVPANQLEAMLWLEADRMGWMGVLLFPAIFEKLPLDFLIWIIAGGLSYTVGAIIFGIKKPNPIPKWFGHHEIWHLFVMAGTFAHFWAFYCFLG